MGNIIDIKTADAKICRYTHYCVYEITKDGTRYNVTGSATYSRTCGQNSFPVWGCEAVKNEIIDRLGPSKLSDTWSLSCGNVHRYTAVPIPTTGSCGNANGSPSADFPTTNLCNIGTLTGQNSTATDHNWSCLGTYGGSPASCSAPIPQNMALHCVANPTTGVANSQVDFTAFLTGTTTPPSAFVFAWKVNNVASTSVYDNTFSNVWSTATNTPNVEVSVSDGVATQKANCLFDRVDCSSNNYYCGDSNPVVSTACVGTSTQCYASACGIGVDEEYDISKDKQLPAGGSLPTTAPSGQYIIDNSLCGAGNILGNKSDGSTSWEFNASYDTWRWDCKNADAAEPKLCKARCMNGEYYCVSQGKCIPDAAYCGCPDGLGGSLDQREACLDEEGNCYGCSKVIEYFKLVPDEIHKDQTTNLCGGFWHTNSMTVPQRPSGTYNARVTCTLKTGASTVSVPATNPTGGTGRPLTIGTHTLTCIQQYQLTGPTEPWKDFQDESLEVKCRAVPNLIEH